MKTKQKNTNFKSCLNFELKVENTTTNRNFEQIANKKCTTNYHCQIQANVG